MAIAEPPAARVAVTEPLIGTLPDRARPDGPVTTARLRRTVGVYAGTVAAGAVLARVAGERRGANAAIGLMAPGAGYLGAGRPLAWAGTQAAFGLSLAAWLGQGNVVAPAATWLGTAAHAGLRHDVRWRGARTAVAAGAAGLVGAAWAARERGHRQALRRRDRRNAFLAERRAAAEHRAEADGRAGRAEPAVTAGAVAAAPRVGPELTADELAFARYVLDRALQPVDSFDGFDRIEQFQTSSVRYQVTTLSHALSTLQYARMPAFRGYLDQAQRNLIDKWQERICWAYWAKESTWGNLRYNPDPVPRDNIMLTGWLGYQLASYVSNSGDERYERPGSITFRHPRGHTYAYDLHSIVGALVRNFERSDFTLYPCEPNWIYALCNGYGILPLPIHDRLYGTDYAERLLPRFRRAFEQEFLSVDGRTVGIRSSLTGLSLPAMTSILSDAAVVWQLAPVYPDLSRALYEILRHEWVQIPERGRVELELKGWDRIDTGNYSRVPATALAAISWAALEMGDTELVERLRADADAILEPVTENGVRRFAKASTLSNAALLGAQVGNVATHRHRVADGMPEAWAKGPILDQCAYPDVLVARAVSDGADLQLVLRPGTRAARRQALGIAQLAPSRSYRVTGAVEDTITAKKNGTATVHVDLHERTELRLVPEA